MRGGAAAGLAAGLALVASGCGGGGDHSSSAPAPARSDTAAVTATTPAPNPGGPRRGTGQSTTGSGGATAPESQPGGAGDEQGNLAPAVLTGRAGRITPAEVSVPPYIAVRVELRSADGRSYGLRFPGHPTVRAGGQLTLTGLRPGREAVGRPVGGGTAVRIVANAEPGP